MDFERLREYEVVARLKSIKKAAEELGCSAATLSARMRSFEKSLNASLFMQDGRELRLSEAGERLYPSAVELLESVSHVRHQLRLAQEHSYRRLRLAVTGSALPLFLGPFLDRLNISYPDMQLELLDDTNWSAEEGLRSGAVDIYFAPVMSDYVIQGMEKEVIAPSNQYVILPRSHPLSARNAISLRELDGERFIPYPETMETCIREFTLRNLRESGIRYTIFDDPVSPHFYKLLVPIGKGLVLLPMPSMELPPNTVILTISDLKHPAAPCFFYNKSSLNPEVHAFVRDYKEFIKEMRQHEHGVHP